MAHSIFYIGTANFKITGAMSGYYFGVKLTNDNFGRYLVRHQSNV
jgi:hypothetical protein